MKALADVARSHEVSRQQSKAPRKAGRKAVAPAARSAPGRLELVSLSMVVAALPGLHRQHTVVAYSQVVAMLWTAAW